MIADDDRENPHRDGSLVTVSALRRPWQAVECLRLLSEAQSEGLGGCVLDVSSCETAYPNAIGTLLPGLDLLRARGFGVDFHGQWRSAELVSLAAPLDATDSAEGSLDALRATFRFSQPTEVHLLVQAVVERLEAAVPAAGGVLIALDWCLNEIMDNVLQHAEIGWGYLTTLLLGRRLSVSICDGGIGILGSLHTAGRVAARDTEAAIRYALGRGTTHDDQLHQGNGLWGLDRIVSGERGSTWGKVGEHAAPPNPGTRQCGVSCLRA